MRKALPMADGRWPIGGRSSKRRAGGFTLIELLVVIAVMAIIAGFTLVVVTGIKRTEYIKVAQAEMGQIENALENYHAKYGVYPPANALSMVGTNFPSQVPPLYYELVGVYRTNNGAAFETLDNSAQISVGQAQSVFGLDGFINCAKTGDEATPAQNFLVGLSAKRIGTAQPAGVYITNLVTTVRGPDANYFPMSKYFPGVNPFRYVYPGTNNPASYDLWVQLQFNNKMYLICNWNKQALINYPLP